jgi:hypothetical protein
VPPVANLKRLTQGAVVAPVSAAAPGVALEYAGVRAPITSPPKIIAAISAAWPQNLRIEADTEHLHIASVGDATTGRRTLGRAPRRGLSPERGRVKS